LSHVHWNEHLLRERDRQTVDAYNGDSAV